jgi:hypothetical protein
MNRTIAAALSLALLSVPMAGCQTLAALEPANVQLRSSQALYVAEAAFTGASLTLETAVDRGVLKGADAAQARKLYGEAHDALLAARQARASGDFALELAKASQASVAAGQLQAMSAAATLGSVKP